MTEAAVETISDEELEAVISSRGFRRLLLYHRLVDGLKFLETHDPLYQSLMEAIVRQHSEIDSTETIEEAFSLLRQRLAVHIEPLSENETGEPEVPAVLYSALEQLVSKSKTGETNPTEAVRRYLEGRLAETGELIIKANEIASDLGFASNHVGGLLGRWRNSNDSPFVITSSGSDSVTDGKIWTIRQAGD